MNTPNKQAELEKEIEKLNNDVKLQQTKLFFLLNSSDNIITDLPMSEAFKFWWFMECKAELKGIKEGRNQAISEFKEIIYKLKLPYPNNGKEMGFYIDADDLEAELEKTAQEIK